MSSNSRTATRGDPFRIALARWADRPIASALAGLMFACAIVGAQLARDGGDISAFVRAAPPWADRATVRADLRIGAAPYDGTFYYRLALDPFTDRATDHGITFDRPGYRQQRILYPLLAWVASGADAARAAAALVMVNIAALTCVGWLGGLLARRSGRHALWGSLFALYPGAVITLTHDLTEIVAAALLLGALLLLRGERTLAAAAMLALAGFARETSALFTAAAGTVRFAAAPRIWQRWLPFAIPAIALLLWQAALALRWRTAPLGQSGEAFDPPLLGLLAAAALNAGRLSAGQAAVWAACLAFVLAMIFLGARALRTAAPYERAAWSVYLALAVVLEANIWANEAMLRALTDLAMLTALMALGASARVRRWLLGLEVALAALLVAGGVPF